MWAIYFKHNLVNKLLYVSQIVQSKPPFLNFRKLLLEKV